MKGFQILRRLTSRVPALLAALGLWAVPSLLRADTSSATITQPTGAVTLYAGQTQLFAGTTDTGGTISWAFGDGGTASGAAVSHTYATAGSYTAVMTVTTTQQVCSLMNPDGSCSRYKNVTLTYTASRSITVLGKPTLSAFSASPSSVVSGTAVTLSWSVSGATALTLSPGGAVSGTSVVVHPTATTTYTLTASNPAGAATATTTVTVTPLTVTLSPATARVAPGGQATFTATVSGGTSPSQAVTWSVVGSGAGSITAAGVYTAPSTPGTYTVKAVATQDGLSAGTATVTVPGWTLKLKKDIVYVGAKEVAEVDASGKTWVTFDDHLGSPRFQWDGAANPVEGTDLVRQKYAPFGEALMDPTAQARFAKGFTGHEQTDPSGLIYMQARFYTPMYGRFLSPDPARDQHFEDTQSWNIYSYVRNSPTMQVDPTGMVAGGAKVHDEQGKLSNTSDTPNNGPQKDAPVQSDNAAKPSDKPEASTPNEPVEAPNAGVRTPDFYTVSIGAGEGGFGQLSLTVDRNTGIYASAGFGVGVSGPLPISLSVTGGFLTQAAKPNESTLVSSISGRSTSISGGAVAGAEVNLKPTGPKAVSVGVMTPQVSATVSNTRYLGNLNNTIGQIINHAKIDFKRASSFIRKATVSLGIALSPDSAKFHF